MSGPARPQVELPLPLVVAVDLGLAALSRTADHEVLALGPRELVPELRARLDGLAAVEASDVPLSGLPAYRYRGVLWIAPDRARWRSLAGGVDRLLADGGGLAVVGRGPLTGLHSAARPGLRLIRRSVDGRLVIRGLDYELVQGLKLGGLQNARWGMLRVAASRLGRPDLVDRCEAAYRDELLQPADASRWSVGVWVARKPSPS